ncbi:hypothetical protein [Burkholderia alba]|uniref:hypothetical protein n=1 Tax=Burkholderia alba TaxID=2683677 RepID=UPI002B05D160|nr:hypothetical protein [Burkholderia alba]
MCGLFKGESHWAHRGPPDTTINARQRWLTQMALANEVLRTFRLRLDDFHGQSFVLTSPTGATALVENFTEVWKMAETMLGRTLDPLDMFIDQAPR